MIHAVILFAFARILVLAAAFPLFHPTDERLHFDAAVRCSQGRLVHGFQPFTPESMRLCVLFGSPEYRHSPGEFPEGLMPAPLWKVPQEQAAAALREKEKTWETWTNMEATQPPLYYLTAGVWYRLGKAAGLKDADAIYWIRFLNGIIFSIFIVLVYRFMGAYFPRDPFYRTIIPVLIAAMPQTAFSTINNDALSPLAAGGAFLALMKLQDRAAVKSALAAGLLCSAAVLVKISNIFILPIAGAAAYTAFNRNRQGNVALFALAGGALGPAAAWAAWNHHAFGDLLGQGGAYKAHALGWTSRPLTAWLRHPLFSPAGFITFVHHLTASFWRGDNQWHGAEVNYPALDWIFTVTTAVFLSCAAMETFKNRKSPEIEDHISQASLLAVAGSVGLMLWVSVAYEFPESGTFPTRAFPFFTSGRVMAGVLVPFLFLYAKGLRFIFRKINLPAAAGAAAIIICCLLVEAKIISLVAPSEYNWLHLPADSAQTIDIR